MIKAREESRHVPRAFILYLPPSLATPANRLLRTSSLPDVLAQLEAALKKSSRKGQDRRSGQATEPLNKVPSRPASFNDIRKLKGKHKDGSAGLSSPKAWFLDVASPTPGDMQAIGRLLHLHPLTLEDVLHRDPREKMEYFPKLGYYFVSFRTVVSGMVRKNFHDQPVENLRKSYEGGTLGEANVYLVVFREGVCTFHFTDVKEHIDGVLNRIIKLEAVRNMSSDWIAHGILDSIVDSLYSFLEEIDKEVTEIEEIVFDGHGGQSVPVLDIFTSPTTADAWEDEKMPDFSSEKISYRSRPPRIKKLRKPLSWFWPEWSRELPPKKDAANTSLLRMARIRRLVTSLARLLAAKSEVVAQLKKRLLTGSISKADDTEVAIYMGDVQDHILTMQHSLSHYERMLSQSHPIYLSQLRNTVSKTKAGADQALIVLTIVSIAVLCIQTLIGVFSMNVTIPRNDIFPDQPYNVFGIVLALACTVLATYLALVRRWWLQSKRRRAAMLRNGNVYS